MAGNDVDQLVDLIKGSTDQAQRKTWWSELNTIANQQAWVIWLPVQVMKVPVRDRFANVRPAVGGTSAGAIVWNAEEFFVQPQGRETH